MSKDDQLPKEWKKVDQIFPEGWEKALGFTKIYLSLHDHYEESDSFSGIFDLVSGLIERYDPDEPQARFSGFTEPYPKSWVTALDFYQKSIVGVTDAGAHAHNETNLLNFLLTLIDNPPNEQKTVS